MLARGLMAELSRRAAEAPPSNDTLQETDRAPAWRGTDLQADPRSEPQAGPR
ncbi:hypothetical protein R1A27_18060 [Methylobacterium sp. NMS12]|uniref:hypothetical protein n=1 Tax=Methylobacterium sp. NMS12 TaxID=3079766 RepID=UPI003F882659